MKIFENNISCNINHGISYYICVDLNNVWFKIGNNTWVNIRDNIESRIVNKMWDNILRNINSNIPIVSSSQQTKRCVIQQIKNQL